MLLNVPHLKRKAGAHLCWRLQGVDVLSLHIVELHQGIPANGGTGSLSRKAQSLHTGHS